MIWKLGSNEFNIDSVGQKFEKYMNDTSVSRGEKLKFSWHLGLMHKSEIFKFNFVVDELSMLKPNELADKLIGEYNESRDEEAKIHLINLMGYSLYFDSLANVKNFSKERINGIIKIKKFLEQVVIDNKDIHPKGTAGINLLPVLDHNKYNKIVETLFNNNSFNQSVYYQYQISNYLISNDIYALSNFVKSGSTDKLAIKSLGMMLGLFPNNKCSQELNNFAFDFVRGNRYVLTKYNNAFNSYPKTPWLSLMAKFGDPREKKIYIQRYINSNKINNNYDDLQNLLSTNDLVTLR